MYENSPLGSITSSKCVSPTITAKVERRQSLKPVKTEVNNPFEAFDYDHRKDQKEKVEPI